MKINKNIFKLQEGGASYSLPEINIYPNNKWGDIARTQGVDTARKWRDVRTATQQGINNFGQAINTIGGFFPVMGEAQSARDLNESVRNKDIPGAVLAGLGLIPFAVPATVAIRSAARDVAPTVRNAGRRIYKDITYKSRIENTKKHLKEAIEQSQANFDVANRRLQKFRIVTAADIGAPNVPLGETRTLSPINPQKAPLDYVLRAVQDIHPEITEVRRVAPTPMNPEGIEYHISSNNRSAHFSVPIFGTSNKATGTIFLPGFDTVYNGKGISFSKGYVGDVNIPQEYTGALRHNLQYVQEKLPGFKPFGSSVGMANIGLPHDVHDIDGFMTLKDFQKLSGKSSPIRYSDNGTPITYKYSLDNGRYGDMGDVDINIVDNNKNYLELFRNIFPKSYYEAMGKVAKTPGVAVEDFDNIKFDKTPEELLNALDPEAKTVSDAFETDFNRKIKHASRPFDYLAYGNPDKVNAGIRMWAKSNFGDNVQFPPVFKDAFNDVDKNKDYLEGWNIWGDRDAIARDPKRMENAYIYSFLDSSISNRGVTTQNVAPGKTVFDAMTTWLPESRGGYGAGLNTVTMGNSGHGNVYGALQPRFDFSKARNISDVVRTVGNDLGFNKYLDQNELKSILGEYYNPNIKNTTDLLRSIPATGDDANAILKKLYEKFNISGITLPYEYGSGNYRSLTRSFNKASDIVSINTPRPNSISSRTAVLYNSDSPSDIRDAFENFNRERDYQTYDNIWDMFDKAQEKLVNKYSTIADREEDKISNYQRLFNKYSKTPIKESTTNVKKSTWGTEEELLDEPVKRIRKKKPNGI